MSIMSETFLFFNLLIWNVTSADVAVSMLVLSGSASSPPRNFASSSLDKEGGIGLKTIED